VHRRRRVRILDREIVTVRRLDVVDAQSVGARRTRAVEAGEIASEASSAGTTSFGFSTPSFS